MTREEMVEQVRSIVAEVGQKTGQSQAQIEAKTSLTVAMFGMMSESKAEEFLSGLKGALKTLESLGSSDLKEAVKAVKESRDGSGDMMHELHELASKRGFVLEAALISSGTSRMLSLKRGAGDLEKLGIASYINETIRHKFRGEVD